MPAARIDKTSVPWPIMLLAIAAGYFILAKLSLFLAFDSSNATPVWPPSGFAFAMILLFGYRTAPAIFIGAFVANFLVFRSNHAADPGTAALMSAGISIGNMSEALAGRFLLHKMIQGNRTNNYFRSVNRVLKFVTAALLMCFVSSLIGSATVLFGKIINQDKFLLASVTWWLGDFSGILLITPLLLIWINYFREPGAIKKQIIRPFELFCLMGLTVVVSGIIFDGWFLSPFIFRWAFWVLPIIVWAAIRFNQHQMITAIFFCCAIAIWGTIDRHGPYSDLSLNQGLLVTQSFISIIIITALTLHGSVVERNRIENDLHAMADQLDLRVRQRTVELEERNIFIETLFDSVEDIMAVFDTKGNYLSVNKKVESVYKINRRELIGRHVLDIYPQLKTSEMYENLQKAIKGDTVHNIGYKSPISGMYFENFYIPLKNHLHEVYGVLVIGHDNTAVMEAKEKIEDINKKLNEAQRLAHIGSWQWDIVADKITWSDELYRIYGAVPGEFEARYEDYLRFIHPEDKERTQQTVQQAYANLEPFDFYHRIIRPDGEERIIHGRGEILVNDKNEPVAMAGTAQDMTEAKQAEMEIKLMAEELLRYNKELKQINAELESFTFVASHDLQEPLRKIRTFLTLIADKELSHLSSTGQDYLRRTVKSAEQMQQLIIDLLSYSRTTGSGEHFKPTDLNAIVAKVHNDLKERIEEKRAIIICDQLPTLEVIPFQFQQLFTNLIGNSLKFCQPDVVPRIEIRYQLESGNQPEEALGTSAKKFHAFAIADNGIGFDAKYNEKIFGLFQRLNSRNIYSGTGIGLSICKKIIENHGGSIEASGDKGKGATVRFYIPA